MTKKLAIVLGVGAMVVVAGGGGAWYWTSHHVSESVVSSDGTPVAINAGAAGDTKSVPLDNKPGVAPPADKNALQVKPAQDLGQTNLSTGSSNQNNTTSTKSSNAAASEPDPSKFVEYEKYKTAQNALFGEMVVGAGADVVAGKAVAVNYKGWLTNGQLFDQSKAGTPFVFTPGAHRVIAGWEEGIMGMKAGGKRLLIVPPVVGYGSTGKDPIPPNAVMVFEIELVEVQP